MGYRKVYIAWFLVLGVFVNTALSGVCLCGNACSQGLSFVAVTPANLLLHLQCTAPEYDRCESEKFEKLKAVDSAAQMRCIDLIKKLFGLDSGSVNLSSHPNRFNLESWYSPSAIPFPPIYLMNLSILL